MTHPNRARLQTLWEDTVRILAELDRYSGGDAPQPRARPPATEQELQALEDHLQLRLPPSYREFLSLHNGIEHFVHDAALLSTAEIIADDPGAELAETVADVEPELTRFIFAGALQSDDIFCFDCATARENGEMDVVQITAYGDEWRSPDFAAFLQGYRDAHLAALEDERRDRHDLGDSDGGEPVAPDPAAAPPRTAGGAPNPIVEMADDGVPLIELKMGIELYLRSAPGPREVMRVYRHYLRHCGATVASCRSTATGAASFPWNEAARERFENELLPELRRGRDWGYAFSDERKTDSALFMFQGCRPHSEAGTASFYRFDFPWDTDPGFILDFTHGLLDLAPFLSGFAGYYFQGRASTRHRPSYDRMFELAGRYPAVEAHNLDVSLRHMLSGYKCVNWLTLIGRQLLDARDDGEAALAAARRAAHAALDGSFGTLLQAGARPVTGGPGEAVDGHAAVAAALLPLQLGQHDALGGSAWTNDNTLAYIRRFTDPESFRRHWDRDGRG